LTQIGFDSCLIAEKFQGIRYKIKTKNGELRKMKVIIEITKAEGDLIMANYPYQLYASNIKSNGKYDLEILDVDKFIEFLNDEIDNCFPVNENGMSQMVSAPNGVFYEGSESQKQDNLFSILSKVKISSE